MKKISTLLFIAGLFLLAQQTVSAQDTIPNKGFDYWDSSGKPAPNNWQEPRGWTSTNALTEVFGTSTSRYQMSGATSEQVRITTLNIFGSPVPGILINGDFTMKISDTSKVPLLGGTPYTKTETKLYGHYNYTATDSTDSAVVAVFFKKWNSATQKPDAVAGGRISLPATGAGLHLFTVDINTIGGGTPDSLVITLVSTKPDRIVNGGDLKVDFVTFTEPSGLVSPAYPSATIIYPNPAADVLNIFSAANNYTYEVLDMAGKRVLDGKAESMNSSADISILAPGCYFVRVNAETTEILKLIID